MKKYLFILVVAILLLFTSCISIDYVSMNPIERLIFIPDVDKDELFVRANVYLAEIFRSSSDVIQYSDKEAGFIVGKYVIENTNRPRYSGYSKYYDTELISLKIEIKDQKVLISLQPANLIDYDDVELIDTELTDFIDRFQGTIKKDKLNW